MCRVFQKQVHRVGRSLLELEQVEEQVAGLGFEEGAD
jgi:hypothetical protein